MNSWRRLSFDQSLGLMGHGIVSLVMEFVPVSYPVHTVQVDCSTLFRIVWRLKSFAEEILMFEVTCFDLLKVLQQTLFFVRI